MSSRRNTQDWPRLSPLLGTNAEDDSEDLRWRRRHGMHHQSFSLMCIPLHSVSIATSEHNERQGGKKGWSALTNHDNDMTDRISDLVPYMHTLLACLV